MASRSAMLWRLRWMLAGLGLVAAPLAAQTGTPDTGTLNASALAAAAAPITVAELRRHLDVLTADSLRERETPSPALERAAQYLATQFQALGLAPGAWNNAAQERQWLERYPLPGQLRLDAAGSAVVVGIVRDTSERNTLTDPDMAAFDRTAYFTMPLSPYLGLWDAPSRGTVLVTGRHSAASLRQLSLANQAVLYVPPAGLDSVAQQQIVAQLYQLSSGVVVLSTPDSGAFAAELAAARQHPPYLVEGYLQNALRPHGWVAHVWPGALASVLAAADIDVTHLRADSTPRARALPLLQVQLRPNLAELPPTEVRTAPNVIGWLEGSDSLLRAQAVVFLAHLDGGGRLPPPLDPLWPRDAGGAGQHDNAVGIAGLVAVAKAFSQAGVRPRRPVLFVATSGSVVPEFWGAAFAALNSCNGQVASVINLDALDHPAGDSVLVAGLEEATGTVRADWIAMAHPELGVRVVDGGTAFASTSDHAGLSRIGRPMLYFHTGAHEASVPETDSFEIEPVARIVRLAFYVGSAIANAPEVPRLNAAGRRQYLTAIDHWD